MSSQIANMLDGLELFSDFSYAELEVIGGYLIFEEAKAGKVIFSEGEPGNFLVIWQRRELMLMQEKKLQDV